MPCEYKLNLTTPPCAAPRHAPTPAALTLPPRRKSRRGQPSSCGGAPSCCLPRPAPPPHSWLICASAHTHPHTAASCLGRRAAIQRYLARIAGGNDRGVAKGVAQGILQEDVAAGVATGVAMVFLSCPPTAAHTLGMPDPPAIPPPRIWPHEPPPFLASTRDGRYTSPTLPSLLAVNISKPLLRTQPLSHTAPFLARRQIS